MIIPGWPLTSFQEFWKPSADAYKKNNPGGVSILLHPEAEEFVHKSDMSKVQAEEVELCTLDLPGWGVMGHLRGGSKYNTRTTLGEVAQMLLHHSSMVAAC